MLQVLASQKFKSGDLLWPFRPVSVLILCSFTARPFTTSNHQGRHGCLETGRAPADII